ncbi:MAG TPA: Calx-beta domain-containing protein, partial [Burkholderiaceae bacterium]|nr:Calx-beta domain-containing protein [Burkholderiaceae bacterium]
VSGQSTVDLFLGGISGADFEDLEIDGVSVGRTLMTSYTFQAGQTGAVVRVRLTQDQVAEGNETLTVMMYDADGEGDLLASGSSVILNDDASLSISAGQASVSEGTDADIARVAAGNTQTFNITYTVTRTGYLTQATTVDWTVLAQNGVDAADFANGVLPSGTLSFASGETSKVITLAVRRDWVGEASEAVIVRLSNASPGAQIITANATTTVTDDDSSIGFAGYTTQGTALALAEGDNNSGWTNFTFTIQRSGSNAREQEVAWRVVADADSGITLDDFYDAYSLPGVNGGNATPTLPYGTVTFAAGDVSTTKTVTIKVRSDTFAVSQGWPTVGSTLEADEPFRVELYNPLESDKHIGYAVPAAAAVAHAVIVNDDVRIQVTEIRTGYAEGRDPAVNGGDVDAFQAGVQRWITQSVTVRRMGDPSQAVSLQWFIDTPGLADRLVLADGSGNLPNGTYGVADGTSAAGIASGSYANGVLSGLLAWAAGDTADKVLYFTAIPDDDPQPDFRFVLKARPNPDATAESARIDEVSVLDGADNYNAIMGANAPLVLANMVVRRDEAALWISNAVERPYDAATSSYQSEDDAIFGVQTFRANRDAGTLSAQGSDEATREGTVISATAGQDYTYTSQTLSFNEAHRSRIVSVNLRNDGTAESRETFSLFLNGASGASIASNQANVTVIDGDGGSNEYRVAVNDATSIE